MSSRSQLYGYRPVRDLVHVLDQVPVRAAYRGPMPLNHASAAALLLWTLIRWERNFLVICLEDLGIDMWQLTRRVDALLRELQGAAPPEEGSAVWPEPGSLGFQLALDRHVMFWLDRAHETANLLGHDYLGTEHLLLAILAEAPDRMRSVLDECGLHYEAVRDAVLDVLKTVPSVSPVEAVAEGERFSGPWGARWDTRPAVGVPRRFGMAVLLLLVTMYAVLFAAMQLLDLAPGVFIMVAVLFAGVGLGQVLLFGGRHPRAASIWVGAILFPVEVLVAMIYIEATTQRVGADACTFCSFVLFAAPVGAGFGYLAGGLTAGVFVILEQLAKRGEEEGDEGDEEEGEGRAEADGQGAPGQCDG